ncbi:DUF397 domain-containing protein [Streptomyces sp. NPDC002795]|uniref:DUF397 domain-containing protein n=1 Tax=Streptomyces sp. NPDC002795 TaxID=3364665 RepID=UPI0036B9555B
MRNHTPEYDLNDAAAWSWRKSSYSGGDGGDCLEVADAHTPVTGIVPVRDSKNPNGPKLALRAAAWSAFIADLRRTP